MIEPRPQIISAPFHSPIMPDRLLWRYVPTFLQTDWKKTGKKTPVEFAFRIHFIHRRERFFSVPILFLSSFLSLFHTPTALYFDLFSGYFGWKAKCKRICFVRYVECSRWLFPWSLKLFDARLALELFWRAD